MTARPHPNNHDPLVREWRGYATEIFEQRESGDTAIAEKNQHHCSEELADHLADGAAK